MSNVIKIGVYEESGELIGYKTDSFWSLSKNNFKPHGLDAAGQIPEHLIKNLQSTLSRFKEENPTIVGVVQFANKRQYFGSYETRLLGYEFETGERFYTHRIFDNEIQELSEEDKAEISARTQAAA